MDARRACSRWRSSSSAPTAPNFATAGNAAEIVRLAVEVGLLALALTPIVIAGGIDLSSGSLLALAAIVLGGLWRDAGLADLARRGGGARASARRAAR